MSIHAPVQPTPRIVDTRPTVLITEHEVKMLTAAAAMPSTKAGLLQRWLTHHRAATEARHQRQRYSPVHYEFLEHSAMARAMEHL
ncbi:hypothetical protein CRM90_03870 [Mycobacterium sp. ENV421]|uniref:hypothetical protein n=1 Tax=Mycobacterium sp. ENV421 TaxID=1213407 RepID=UPI000C9B00B5|nr:hypothetical protein [Mycobacterium sp. ENV421]PND59276.1 hypothetical protein CRM90_03870 [Mycobacterium sp. ENV421]